MLVEYTGGGWKKANKWEVCWGTGQADFGVNSWRDQAHGLLGIFLYFSSMKEIPTC